MERKSDFKTRGFTFTAFEDTNYEHYFLFLKEQSVDYIICGEEICPTTGRKHLQSYVYFTNPRSLSGVIKLFKKFGHNDHIEIANGSPIQNFEYCSKDKNFHEWGTLPQKGKRTDLLGIAESIKEQGFSIRKTILNGDLTSLQSLAIAEKMMKYIEPPRSDDAILNIKWFYGPSGTGKTTTARKELGPDRFEHNLDSLKWWDSYDGEESVLIDEFRKEKCPLSTLLTMLQPGKFMVEVKGGMRQFKGLNIIITCPFHPDDVYFGLDDTYQLVRRITELRYFGTVMEHKSGGNTLPPTLYEEPIPVDGPTWLGIK